MLLKILPFVVNQPIENLLREMADGEISASFFGVHSQCCHKFCFHCTTRLYLGRPHTFKIGRNYIFNATATSAIITLIKRKVYSVVTVKLEKIHCHIDDDIDM